ncbi:MAG: DUF4442 domain-containing protein [Sphingobacteriia bacterium]|nr:DUF4442 domain-containing protein [Sphingobacteriia bacterium]
MSFFENFKELIKNPIKYKSFLFSKLPMALVAGLKVVSLEQEGAVVEVYYKWLNKNPFRSIYFAVLSMAAELSTGVLCFGNIYGKTPGVSMLITGLKASFHKKAVGRIRFTCNDGLKIKQAIDEAYATGEGQVLECTSKGFNENNEVVAEFIFIWSIKLKK